MKEALNPSLRAKYLNSEFGHKKGSAMQAYKFRPPSQFHFALDILFNQRLYCADWRFLNDPMEGLFAYSHRSTDERDYKKEVADIVNHEKQIRVCSLSRTFDCHLLWAHYAEGFSGLAIEVQLPEDDPRVRQVKYGGVFAGLHFGGPVDTLAAAEAILSSKYEEWQHEQEVRVLSNADWFELRAPVKRVIAGHRMEPALFRGLQIVCERQNIELCRTGIGDMGIDADYVPPLEK